MSMKDGTPHVDVENFEADFKGTTEVMLDLAVSAMQWAKTALEEKTAMLAKTKDTAFVMPDE